MLFNLARVWDMTTREGQKAPAADGKLQASYQLDEGGNDMRLTCTSVEALSSHFQAVMAQRMATGQGSGPQSVDLDWRGSCRSQLSTYLSDLPQMLTSPGEGWRGSCESRWSVCPNHGHRAQSSFAAHEVVHWSECFIGLAVLPGAAGTFSPRCPC